MLFGPEWRRSNLIQTAILRQEAPEQLFLGAFGGYSPIKNHPHHCRRNPTCHTHHRLSHINIRLPHAGLAPFLLCCRSDAERRKHLCLRCPRICLSARLCLPDATNRSPGARPVRHGMGHIHRSCGGRIPPPDGALCPCGIRAATSRAGAGMDPADLDRRDDAPDHGDIGPRPKPMCWSWRLLSLR